MESKDLMVFTNDVFGNVRVVMKDGEPYFVGIDVAKCLGYADPSSTISKKCKYGVKTMLEAPCFGSKVVKTQTTIIPEKDLYRLILDSELPSAIKFQDWVYEEVLPSIRKNGYYSVAPIQDERTSLIMSVIDAPDAVSTALAVKNLTTFIEAPLKEEIKNQQEQLALQAHKVDFYDAVTKSDDLLTMKEATDILAIKGYGRNKTLALLRFKRIFNDKNVPYRQYTDKGYFAVKEHDYTTKYGNTRHNSTTYVTHKGLEFLRKVILKDMENKKGSSN